jgi:uncharacterized membrane protein YccC
MSTTIEARAGASVLEQRKIRMAVGHGVALASSCLISYWLATHVLSRVHSLSRADDLLGGMWAVIATIFVYHESHRQSAAAALTRAAATLLSFGLCLIYLLILPFHPLGLAALIGVGTVLLMLIDRGDDVATTAITTAVVMVVAAVSPHDAWEQPILRLFDTALGIAVGLIASSIAQASDVLIRRNDHLPNYTFRSGHTD